MIKIAVIDDGANREIGKHLLFDIAVNDNYEIVQRISSEFDIYSHGTTCMKIIDNYAREVRIGSIKILDGATKKGFVKKLEYAIDWCTRNSISIINLSLGSVNSADYEALARIINHACDNKIVVVAAHSNENLMTYPASFENVIGVKADQALDDDMYYMATSNTEGVDVVASAAHKAIDKRLRCCNSFATPLVTAKISNILCKRPDMTMDMIKTKLADQSCKSCDQYTEWNLPKKELFIDNAHGLGTTPCIVVSCKNQTIPYMLNSTFHRNGYNTAFILSEDYEKKNNAWIVDSKQMQDEAICLIAAKHDADIVIIGLSHRNTVVNVSCDILFYEQMSTIGELLIMNHSSGIVSDMKLGFKSVKSAEFIYTKVVELLS